MFVYKRSGVKEPLRFDKITDRNIELASNLNINIEYLSQLVIKSLKNGMKTSDIDILSSETAYCLSDYEPDYDILAARIAINNLTKSTFNDFMKVTDILYNNTVNGVKSPLINDIYYNFVKENITKIKSAINYTKDYKFTYFGFKTLLKTYLYKVNDETVERPQHMFMRVALAIHGPRVDLNNGKEYPGNINKAIKTYKKLSDHIFIHATPTLYHAGSKHAQLSSCFLLHMEDSLMEIYNTIHHCAMISQKAGGIGINISNIRSTGSIIKGNNGKSNGIVPMIKVLDATARYVDQGNKRKGSIALYIEPWHPEIVSFLHLRDKDPPESMRARDIFLAMWIPDLFMKRVYNNEVWSLMDPSVIYDTYGIYLNNVYGDTFEQYYTQAEKDGKYVKQIPAREIWEEILKIQMETGLPYMLYKDHVNHKSNQKNIGTIKSSNLCIEIMEYTDKDNVSVCTLGSIVLHKFIKDKTYDFKKLGKVVEMLTENLNNILDLNHYPIKEAITASQAQRAIGIGVQGLADVFFQLGYSWDSIEAKNLNRYIFETIYYHAIKKSSELAMELGSYPYFKGSPISEGVFSFDMWNEVPYSLTPKEPQGDIVFPVYNWEELRSQCKQGVRNSLLIALMPTATTAQIFGNTEGAEALTSNVYSRTVISGEFPIINKYLHKDLDKLNLWTRDIVQQIITDGGSVQNIPEIPNRLKNIYKTVWEIPQKVIIDLARDRSPFICQGQSMNIYKERPTLASLSSLHYYSWNRGMKCSSYYLRTKPSTQTLTFSSKPKVQTSVQSEEALICRRDNKENCELCSA